MWQKRLNFEVSSPPPAIRNLYTSGRLLSLFQRHEMRTKTIIVVVSIALLGVLGVVFFSKLHYVDPSPALEVGGEYYSRLQQGEVDGAFALYTRGFLRKAGADWRQIITQLDAKEGNVIGFRLIGSHVVPLRTNDGVEIPCVLVRYEVTRTTLTSEERLIACPRQPVAWAIAGHEILSKNNGQRFSAGVTFQEKTILTLGIPKD